MRGSSASCYVETPRLEGLGVKNDVKNLVGINFQRNEINLLHKIVFNNSLGRNLGCNGRFNQFGDIYRYFCTGRGQLGNICRNLG